MAERRGSLPDHHLTATAISSIFLAVVLLAHYKHYPSVRADAWAYQT
jgi:hypothetical protein